MNSERVEKILCIKVRSLGDTVLLSSSLQVLSQKYPNASIDLVIPDAYVDLYDGYEKVSKVYGFKKNKRLLLLFRLRKNKYDIVLNFHASTGSALFSKLSGGKKLGTHFHGLKDSNRFSDFDVPGKGQIKPIIERDLDLVRSLGVLIENAPLPSLYTIHDLNDYSQKSQPVLTIGLGASRKTKMWPIINYREIAIKWNLITGGSVVLVVGNNEEELIDQFQKAGPKLLFIRVEKGRPLKELSAILKSSDLFLGNDSGPRHLAAALGTKTVTVFGPEDPYEWHPYPIERHPFHFIENLNCREDAPKGFPAWCGIEDCVKQSHRCMRSISVEQVFDSCIKMAGLLK